LIDRDIIFQIDKDLGLGQVDVMTEEEVLAILAQRITQLLSSEKDLLMSYLYRLDIPMDQIARVLRVTNVIPPNESLARLILDRQIKRVETKKMYKQDPIEGWEF
jgi:hypothetical protein